VTKFSLAALMQLTTLNTDSLSADDIAVYRLAFTEVTLHTNIASNTGWPFHSYTEGVDRRVAFQQKLINIEQRGNILYYFEAEAVLSKLLRHSWVCAYM